jgi:hypothetical protein
MNKTRETLREVALVTFREVRPPATAFIIPAKNPATTRRRISPSEGALKKAP